MTADCYSNIITIIIVLCSVELNRDVTQNTPSQTQGIPLCTVGVLRQC